MSDTFSSDKVRFTAYDGSMREGVVYSKNDGITPEGQIEVMDNDGNLFTVDEDSTQSVMA